MGEVTHLAHGVHYYAEAATKVRGAYQDLPSTLGPAYGMVIRRPMGVCVAITPYNFPLTLLGTKVAPALAAGCTMVLKPSEYSPLSALLFAEVLEEAGLPRGVFNLVNGDGPGVGVALASHPDIDDNHTSAGLPRKNVDRRATVQEILHNLPRDRSRIRADTFGSHSVIAREDIHDALLDCRRHQTRDVSQLNGQRLQPAQAAGRLRQ